MFNFWRFHSISLFQCIQMAPNASEMKENHPFWVRTHFGYFKTWFGVIILLFYHYFWRREKPSAPRRPLVPPWTPRCPLTPGMSSWTIVSHPGSFWVIFDTSGVNNSSVYTTVHCTALWCPVVHFGGVG